MTNEGVLVRYQGKSAYVSKARRGKIRQDYGLDLYQADSKEI